MKSPLRDAGLTKNDIRLLSREFGLNTWDKPSFACLPPRIPYRQKITPEKLRQVDEERAVPEGIGLLPPAQASPPPGHCAPRTGPKRFCQARGRRLEGPRGAILEIARISIRHLGFGGLQHGKPESIHQRPRKITIDRPSPTWEATRGKRPENRVGPTYRNDRKEGKYMDSKFLMDLLTQVQGGQMDLESAMHQLKHLPFEDLGYARIDNHRCARTGVPEVIYCEGKSIPQIQGIVKRIAKHHSNILATRASERSLPRRAGNQGEVRLSRRRSHRGGQP